VTSSELSQLIAIDLAAHQGQMIWGGRPLDRCLVKPTKIVCLNSHAENQPENYWLVFEEAPSPGEGYKVVYDEELREFGLAVAGVVEPVVIGIYGGFVDTLNSM
jgi:hypothetical protein